MSENLNLMLDENNFFFFLNPNPSDQSSLVPDEASSFNSGEVEGKEINVQARFFFKNP